MIGVYVSAGGLNLARAGRPLHDCQTGLAHRDGDWWKRYEPALCGEARSQLADGKEDADARKTIDGIFKDGIENIKGKLGDKVVDRKKKKKDDD